MKSSQCPKHTTKANFLTRGDIKLRMPEFTEISLRHPMDIHILPITSSHYPKYSDDSTISSALIGQWLAFGSYSALTKCNQHSMDLARLGYQVGLFAKVILCDYQKHLCEHLETNTTEASFKSLFYPNNNNNPKGFTSPKGPASWARASDNNLNFRRDKDSSVYYNVYGGDDESDTIGRAYQMYSITTNTAVSLFVLVLLVSYCIIFDLYLKSEESISVEDHTTKPTDKLD